MIKIGSLFSGIGGFELGLERAIPDSETVFQVEIDAECRRILRKHWQSSNIFEDIKSVGSSELADVDLLCGGFPCQDLSWAGSGGGLNGKRSGLWWEMYRIICDLRPRVVVLENVPAIASRGLDALLGCFAEIGYDVEWTVISARQFGAPHLRARWFAIAYPHSLRSLQAKHRGLAQVFNNEEEVQHRGLSLQREWGDCWEGFPFRSPVCSRTDGVSIRLARLKALGNAIVPECSEYIGKKIYESGILEG